MEGIHGEGFEGVVALEEREETGFPFGFGGVEEGEGNGTGTFLAAEKKEGRRGGGGRGKKREDVFFGGELRWERLKGRRKEGDGRREAAEFNFCNLFSGCLPDVRHSLPRDQPWSGHNFS